MREDGRYLGMVGFNDGQGDNGVKTTLNCQLRDGNAWKVI
jgi:hypothetical protein